MKTPLLEVRELKKSFGTGAKRVDAVRGVSFSISPGQCFGLLGPNGAGKTTTIEMMEGITYPDSGSVLFRGKPIGTEFRQKSGIQFQSTALQDFLTVREVLKMFSQLYREPANLEEIYDLCSLREFLDRDTHALSGGQRQRCLIAVALVNDPDLVFLDEPTTGLDPQARRNFWDLIRKIQRRGKTILLTTHYMEEAYELCDEIAIMDRGKIISQGSPNQLLKEHFAGVSIEIPQEDFQGASLAGFSRKVSERSGQIEIFTPESEIQMVLKELMELQVPLGRLRIRSQTLEDLFLSLTGKELRS